MDVSSILFLARLNREDQQAREGTNADREAREPVDARTWLVRFSSRDGESIALTEHAVVAARGDSHPVIVAGGL